MALNNILTWLLDHLIAGSMQCAYSYSMQCAYGWVLLSPLFTVITWKVSFHCTWGSRAEMKHMKDFRSIPRWIFWQYRTSLDLVKSILWIKVVFFLDLSLLVKSSPLKKSVYLLSFLFIIMLFDQGKKEKGSFCTHELHFFCTSSLFYWFYFTDGMELVDEGQSDLFEHSDFSAHWSHIEIFCNAMGAVYLEHVQR